jgi:hypothetical protein
MQWFELWLKGSEARFRKDGFHLRVVWNQGQASNAVILSEAKNPYPESDAWL